MFSWKLDFPRQVYTVRVILISVAEYDAGNSCRTAPTSLSVTLACTLHIATIFCGNRLIHFDGNSVPMCSSHSCSTGSNHTSHSLSVARSRHALFDKKCSMMVMSSYFAACRGKIINSSHGAGILFNTQLVECMSSCG